MLSFGFSTRHWQQVEAGRPITVTTLLRICEVFEMPMSKLVHGLDTEGVLLMARFRQAGKAMNEKNGRDPIDSAASGSGGRREWI
jgi:hypothetical protein